MGRNTQKLTDSFNKVVRNKKELLEQIDKCTSQEMLGALKTKYKANKNNNYFVGDTICRKLSDEKQRVLIDLHDQVTRAIAAKERMLSVPEVDLVPSLGDEGLVDENNEALDPQLQVTRRLETAHIESELVNVDKKRARMAAKGAAYEGATLATGRIHDALQQLTDKYIKDGDLQHYQEQTRALFDETTDDMKTINQHRGWAKNFFGNLAYFILGLGVGYAAVCAYRGKFFEFNTETANVVGAVNEKISALTVN
ncbi:hypothetical protein [Legionella rowbothamii]|uniref:hypothetical protein n=1 Tax=Legionella rowbothamii TaxID=96229 RepID=UPI001056446E|nr:hypothetical protein [Legionella rowbothamii]